MLTPRSILIRLTLCLLLGAATAWVVAAVFAVWPEGLWPRRLTQAQLRGENWVSGPGAHQAQRFGAGRAYRGVLTTMWPPRTPLDPDARILSWADWPTATPDELLASPMNLAQEGFGWPALSFWYPVANPGFAPPHAGPGGFDLIRITGDRRHLRRAIPLRPIWKGVLIDTGFYGALWMLPLFGLPLLRQRRRRKQGRCPRCGYDLKGAMEAGCPECG